MSESLEVPHTAEAHDVIAAELVACTLGERHRAELRVGYADLAESMRVAFAPIFRAVEAYGRAFKQIAGVLGLPAPVRGDGIEPPTRRV